jgi:hypothetical protein
MGPDGRVISAGVFTLCDGIVQYHLGGTRTQALKLSPMALLLDTVRRWGGEQGARVFHLGGGVGASADSLFQFKSGFTEARHEFACWRWILDRSAYDAACAERSGYLAMRGLELADAGYFPAYRAAGRAIVTADEVYGAISETNDSPRATGVMALSQS